MRRVYLDNIRWITVVLVVIYHVIYIYNGVQPFGVIGPFRDVQYQDAFMYLVYPWFMAILFIVAGISARLYLNNHTNKEFIKSKTIKLLIPSTIGLFVFQWTLGYFNIKIGGGFEALSAAPKPIYYLMMCTSGIGPLWFIQVLWLFSVILVLVRMVEKDRLFKLGAKTNIIVIILLGILFYFSSQVLNTPIITVYRFGIYGVSYFLGYFVFYHEEVLDRLSKYWIVLLIAAVILGIAYTVIYFGDNYAVEPTINNVLAIVYAYVAILAIFSLMYRFGNFTGSLCNYMIKKSFGLYMCHYLPIAIVAYYLQNTDVLPVICYLLVVIAGFGGGLMMYEMLSRIPVIRLLVLGIKKQKNNIK